MLLPGKALERVMNPRRTFQDRVDLLEGTEVYVSISSSYFYKLANYAQSDFLRGLSIDVDPDWRINT